MSGVTISGRLYRATKDNTFLQDLSDLVVNGFVDWNADRAGGTHMASSVEVREPRRFSPLTDYFAPVLRLQFDDGRPTVEEQMGLFVCDLPNETHRYRDATARLEGRDLTWLLANDIFDEPYNVPSGTNFTTAREAIIEGAGITRHNIRPSNRTTGYTRTFPAGMSRLDAVNAMSRAIGWYDLFADRRGILTTLPYRRPEVIAPSATYTEHDMHGEVQVIPTTTTLANVIVVVKDNPSQEPLTAIRRNDDPTSPTSTVSLGREIVRRVEDGTLEDQDAVDVLADRLFAEASSYYQVLRFNVRPNSNPGIHRTVDLNISTPDGRRFKGRYFLRTWRVGFTPRDALTELEVNRIVDLDATEDEAA